MQRVMDEHYRRLHYVQNISKKRDKYGSLSAHSTSAIYGRHYYAPSSMWYASVRSLNPHPYQWRAYEDVTKEVFTPPVHGSCVCVARRRPPNSHPKQRPKCIKAKKLLIDESNEKVPSSRMTAYRKDLKFVHHLNKGSTKDSCAFSRKSILECDVTAYDLIKKVVKTPSDDSDLDDNLSDNAIAKMSHQVSKISQNENSILNESSSVLVCGQRIFTHHLSENPSGSKTWRSDESICIPDPDYDDSDESESVIESKCRNPKFTYSPPPLRHSFDSHKELSKSMSSLLSDHIETFSPVSSAHNSRRLYETSSDSSGSDYPTWTSNELKSILKKKRIRQLREDFRDKKKQVQFIGTKYNEKIHVRTVDTSVINCDTYETIPDILDGKTINEGDGRPLVRSSSLEAIKDDRPSSDALSRSLPDSPLSFLSKEKIYSASRSTFYVSVENENQTHNNESEVIKTTSHDNLSVVLPSNDETQNQLSLNEQQSVVPESEQHFLTDQHDTDDDDLENDYENLDPIYEELNDISSSTKQRTESKSFFEGASKIDILSYLEDAKERGLTEDVILEEDEEEDLGEKKRVKNDINEVLLTIKETQSEQIYEDETKSREVERNDSGVGTETSKPSRLKDWELCADCEVEPTEDELVCRKCEFRRCERKEIILEFVDTELKYGRDLRIIKEEFYRPMEIAGLLAKEQLYCIFLNLDELIAANAKFSEKLQDTLDIAMEHGDEDYTTVNLGKLFLESSSMMHAFETYCVKQASASVLLSGLEKEKELLRIFLRVSQMENTLLRRMNLPAFLMVPVQRVTRYPLLLSRLYKVTPIHHKDRGALKEAQQKVELHLEHINQQTKGVGGTKIWRRISNISASHRRLGKDIGSIKLRKMALEALNWKQDETRFVQAGKLFFTPITDYPWNKKSKFTCVHALLVALGKPNSNYRPENATLEVLFPRNTGIRDASLVLMKEKNGRFLITRDPLYLGNCVVSCESENDDAFEMQEYTTKDSYVFKGESKKETKEWLRMLRYHVKDLGSWRKRRNALANIMINGMIRQ